jgi:hypothetical protein
MVSEPLNRAQQYRDKAQESFALADGTVLQKEYIKLAAYYLKLAKAEEKLTLNEQRPSTAFAAYLGWNWKSEKL